MERVKKPYDKCFVSLVSLLRSFVCCGTQDRMRLNKSSQTSLPLLYSTFTIFPAV